MATELELRPQRGLLPRSSITGISSSNGNGRRSLVSLRPCLAVMLYSFLVTPVYTASGTVWIEDNPNILPFEDVQSFGPE